MPCTNCAVVVVVIVVRYTLDSLILFLFEYKELSAWCVFSFLAVCITQICLRGRRDSIIR